MIIYEQRQQQLALAHAEKPEILCDTKITDTNRDVQWNQLYQLWLVISWLEPKNLI